MKRRKPKKETEAELLQSYIAQPKSKRRKPRKLPNTVEAVMGGWSNNDLYAEGKARRSGIVPSTAAERDAAVAAFLAKGGKVTKCPAPGTWLAQRLVYCTAGLDARFEDAAE
jgi:hypothetical protein